MRELWNLFLSFYKGMANICLFLNLYVRRIGPLQDSVISHFSVLCWDASQLRNTMLHKQNTAH